MKIIFVTAAAMIALSTQAFASGDRNNNANASASAGAIAGAAAINSNRIGVDLRNSIRNSVDNDVRNTVRNSNSQGQHQGQGQRQSANNDGVTGNSVSFGGDTTTVEAAAMAPALAALTASNGTCLGSMSASAGTLPISLGFGSTVEDEQCTLRANIGVVMGLANILDDAALRAAALTMVQGLDGFPAAEEAPAPATVVASRATVRNSDFDGFASVND